MDIKELLLSEYKERTSGFIKTASVRSEVEDILLKEAQEALSVPTDELEPNATPQPNKITKNKKETSSILRNIQAPKPLKFDRVTKSSLEERLIKIANQLDQNGYKKIADKIDILLENI